MIGCQSSVLGEDGFRNCAPVAFSSFPSCSFHTSVAFMCQLSTDMTLHWKINRRIYMRSRHKLQESQRRVLITQVSDRG